MLSFFSTSSRALLLALCLSAVRPEQPPAPVPPGWYNGVSMGGWLFVIYEIFAGEASRMSAAHAPASVQSAYQTMRLIVVFGWAVYPIGYFLGYLTGGDPADSSNVLNIVYNFADVLNKIAFGVVIWSVAVSESEAAAAK